MVKGKEKGIDFCIEQDGKLIFDPETKENYLWGKTPEELKEIYAILPNCDAVFIDADLSPADNFKFKDGAEVYLYGIDKLPDNIDISNCSVIELSGRDLSQIKPQKLRDGSTFIYNNYHDNQHFDNLHFNKNLDISGCDEVIMKGINLEDCVDMRFKNDVTVCLSNCTNLPPYLDVSNCKTIYLDGCDLSSIKNLRFKEGANISLANCQNIPNDIDITHCSTVNLSGVDLSKINNLKFVENSVVNLTGCRNFLDNLDVSKCININLSECDISKIENLKFKEGAKVNLSKSQLPKNLDLNNCDEVDLSGCDLSNIKSIKFKEGAKINLSGCKNIPQDIDISKCSEVDLSKCDLSHIDNLQLKDGVKFNIEKSKLPQNIDFSKCQSLNLSGCDLSHLKAIKFRKDACISIFGCQNLPKDLDVSMCREVWVNLAQTENINMGQARIVLNSLQSGKLDFSNLNNFYIKGKNEAFDGKWGGNLFSFAGVSEIIFRDEAQYRDFLKRGQTLPENCKVSFSKEPLKEKMRSDWQKAKATAKRKQDIIKDNHSNKTELKDAIKNRRIPRAFINTDKNIPNMEKSISIYVQKPFIVQRIKRQNG